MRNLIHLRNHLNLLKESHRGKYLTSNSRFYHSKHGVYGYVPQNYDINSHPGVLSFC